MDLKSLICAALALLVLSILPSPAEAYGRWLRRRDWHTWELPIIGKPDMPVGIPPGLFCDKAAITITAPNVHLDGQGFTLTGSLFIGIGIQITAPDVQVRNITVESFDTGIEIREGHSNHL
jgi:hypothetical protein